MCSTMKARIRALPTLGALFVVITATGPVSAAPRPPVTSLLELRQANVVMQKWDISCGAAALATVLTYSLAHPVSEETIARAMLQQRNPERVRQRLRDLATELRGSGVQAEAITAAYDRGDIVRGSTIRGTARKNQV